MEPDAIIAGIKRLHSEYQLLKIRADSLESELNSLRIKNKELQQWNKNKQQRIAELETENGMLKRRLKINQVKKEFNITSV